MQKACGTEKNRLDGIGVLVQFREACSLGENLHGESIAAVAERLCDRLKEGSITTVGFGDLPKTSSLELGAMEGGLLHQCGNLRNVHVSQWSHTASCAGDGSFALGALQSDCEIMGRNDDLRNQLVLVIADEMLTFFSTEADVQHYLAVGRIDGVLMMFPVARVGIELECAVMRYAIDQHHNVMKIWSSTAIPFAELRDFHLLSSRANKPSAKRSREPERL